MPLAEYDKTIDQILSYDVTVIWWITACHKNYMTMHVITLWHKLIIDNVHVNNVFSY